MKIRAKNGEQMVDITLPATDMDIQYCMKCIEIEDIVPVCCISAVSYTHLFSCKTSARYSAAFLVLP